MFSSAVWPTDVTHQVCTCIYRALQYVDMYRMDKIKCLTFDIMHYYLFYGFMKHFKQFFHHLHDFELPCRKKQNGEIIARLKVCLLCTFHLAIFYVVPGI